MKKSAVTRRQKNRELGKLDQANRCVFCKRKLPLGYLIFLTAGGDSLRYCNTDCRDDHADALAWLAASRQEQR